MASDYEEPLKKMLHKFKFSYLLSLSYPLSEILIKAFQNYSLELPDIISYVPLHPLKERLRGFNQSQLLAENFSKKIAPGMSIPVLPVLKRKKLSISQKKLKTQAERLKNIHESFAINQEVEIKNKTILLIDDLVTTGSTIIECAKTLKSGRAKKVIGLSLARQKRMF